jgi:hypothetical protein
MYFVADTNYFQSVTFLRDKSLIDYAINYLVHNPERFGFTVFSAKHGAFIVDDIDNVIHVIEQFVGARLRPGRRGTGGERRCRRQDCKVPVALGRTDHRIILN